MEAECTGIPFAKTVELALLLGLGGHGPCPVHKSPNLVTAGIIVFIYYYYEVIIFDFSAGVGTLILVTVCEY